MKKHFLWGLSLGLSMLFLTGSLSTQTQLARYVSPWTAIPAGKAVSFTHNLGVRPLEMDVWLAPFVNTPNGQCLVNFTAVTPGYGSPAIQVRIVNLTEISIYNNDSVLRCVQVIARP